MKIGGPIVKLPYYCIEQHISFHKPTPLKRTEMEAALCWNTVLTKAEQSAANLKLTAYLHSGLYE